MTTKKALTELRKLVPLGVSIRAEVSQLSGCEDGLLHPAECFIRVASPQYHEEFSGNCLEPCLQAASAWAVKEFKRKKKR